MTDNGGNVVRGAGDYPGYLERLLSAPGVNPVIAYREGTPETVPDSGYLISIIARPGEAEGVIDVRRYDRCEFVEDSRRRDYLTVDLDTFNTTWMKVMVVRRVPLHREHDTTYWGMRPSEAEARLLPGSGNTVFTQRELTYRDKAEHRLTQVTDGITSTTSIHRTVATRAEVRSVLEAVADSMSLEGDDRDIFMSQSEHKLTDLDLDHQNRQLERLTQQVEDYRQVATSGLARIWSAVRAIRRRIPL
jgi:hypothetical protein